MENQTVSLEAILASKENRVRTQQVLIKDYKRPVISFGLNIPGPIKDTPAYRFVHREGVRALHDALNQHNIDILYKEVTHKGTGSEGFFSIDGNEKKVKKITMDIEEAHPLGRLFDFDVIDQRVQSISRSDLGRPSRTCLICDNPAVICARSRRHNLEDILQEIENRINTYKSRRKKKM